MTNTNLLSSFSAPPTNSVIFIPMKYPFLGWRCARNKDYLLPTFRTIQSELKLHPRYHSNRKRDWCPWGDPAPPSIRFVLGKVSLICRVFNDENQHQKRMKQWKQLIDKVSNDENQHHILWCPSIIIFPIRPVMPRGKENLMALLHYPQKVTIIKILEKVDFKTDKKFRNHSFWDKKIAQKKCILRRLLICNNCAYGFNWD